MHDEARIAEVLRALPLISADRYVTRFIYEAHRGTALEVIGALRMGGRYNPPGVPALYTSLRRVTALAEATHRFEDDDPIRPMAMLSVYVGSTNIADLTQAAALRALGTNRAELSVHRLDWSHGTDASQILGRVAHTTGRIHGLLVRSRVLPQEKNLVLFPDRLGMSYDLHDPGRNIPSLHPAIMEAIRALMELS